MADFVAAEQILVWFLSFRALSRRLASGAPAARRGCPCLPSPDSPARVLCLVCPVSRIHVCAVNATSYKNTPHWIRIRNGFFSPRPPESGLALASWLFLCLALTSCTCVAYLVYRL